MQYAGDRGCVGTGGSGPVLGTAQWSTCCSTYVFVIVFVTCHTVGVLSPVVGGISLAPDVPSISILGVRSRVTSYNASGSIWLVTVVMENKISWHGLILYVGINIK